MRKVLLAGFGIVVVVGVFSLNRIRTREEGKPLLHVAAADGLPVSVVTPIRQAIAQTVQAPGEVEAVLEVEIRSEIPAKIDEMPVEEGAAVKAGQLLCRLNDDEFRATVESGEASIARLNATIRQAEAELAKCQRDCARQEHLDQLHATSRTELADYQTRLIQAEAAVEITRQELAEAEARLRQARDSLQKTIITSPINGVISKIHAKPGEVVVTGTMNNPGTVVMVITDLSQMQVRTRVDETDVPLVKPEQPVDIYLPSDPQRAIPGRVLRVAASGTKPAGRDVVTFETLILVESDDPAIKPGMTANVEIEVSRKDDVLTIPVQAVVHRKRKDIPENLVKDLERRMADAGIKLRHEKAQYLTVLYCMNDDKAHPHLIRTGIANETYVELLDGITGEDVVITGPYRSLDQLKDGTRVKLEEATSPVIQDDGEVRLADEKTEGGRSDSDKDGLATAE